MTEDINLFELVDREYIQPEIERRRANGQLPTDFQVRECLILLPGDAAPTITFNNEFGWHVKPKLAPGIIVEEDRPIYLHEIEEVGEVLPPMVDGRRVTFIYLFWDGQQYKIIIDPYHPVFLDRPFEMGELIADHLRNRFKEMAIRNAKFVSKQLKEIGLWPVTALLPYPISKIVERIGESKTEEARHMLTTYCDISFLRERIVQTWHHIPAFEMRMQFFDDALFNHQNGRYHGSISILVGQIEGVLTDWMLAVGHYPTDKYRDLPQKVSDFGDCVQKIPDLLWLYREARNSMLDFLADGPWLQKFWHWNLPIDTAFVSRNAAQHGKYVPVMYSEENSIKLFLLLDTICQFMTFYEERVLKRDWSQEDGNST